MSHMQKGLQSTVQELLPNAERRTCARHIWANWQKKWRDEERRRSFWRCAQASFEPSQQPTQQPSRSRPTSQPSTQQSSSLCSETSKS
ncbi:hypothetical protein RND71_026307 [Anisodus tanguticus]|uniref:Transposase n=1 Tax=Anisodus tanguticus TaxID=243964 RepID=A0AAE1V2R5_9SOLA|nr:hypothetical protein RND71_026307 [Anisodus tanguticus]